MNGVAALNRLSIFTTPWKWFHAIVHAISDGKGAGLRITGDRPMSRFGFAVK
jgi:hypothetical protein